MYSPWLYNNGFDPDHGQKNNACGSVSNDLITQPPGSLTKLRIFYAERAVSLTGKITWFPQGPKDFLCHRDERHPWSRANFLAWKQSLKLAVGGWLWRPSPHVTTAKGRGGVSVAMSAGTISWRGRQVCSNSPRCWRRVSHSWCKVNIPPGFNTEGSCTRKAALIHTDHWSTCPNPAEW